MKSEIQKKKDKVFSNYISKKKYLEYIYRTLKHNSKKQSYYPRKNERLHYAKPLIFKAALFVIAKNLKKIYISFSR